MADDGEGTNKDPLLDRLRWLGPLAALVLICGCVSRYLTPGAVEYRQGSDAAAKGDYEGALRSYDSAIQANPKEPVFYLNRGAVYFAQKNFDRAIEDFDHALSLKPDYAAAFVDRGNAYLSKGNQDRAILDYDQAVILMPNLYPAILNRATAYYAKRDYRHAIDDYRRAVELNPNPPNYLLAFDRNQRITWKQDLAQAQNCRCWFRAVTGTNLEAALSECNESLKLQPKSAATLDSRAFVHFRMNQFEKAIVDADAALELYPMKASTLYVRGLARHRLGDVAGGDRDLGLARSIDPRIDDLYLGAGAIHQGDP